MATGPKPVYDLYVHPWSPPHLLHRWCPHKGPLQWLMTSICPKIDPCVLLCYSQYFEIITFKAEAPVFPHSSTIDSFSPETYTKQMPEHLCFFSLLNITSNTSRHSQNRCVFCKCLPSWIMLIFQKIIAMFWGLGFPQTTLFRNNAYMGMHFYYFHKTE